MPSLKAWGHSSGAPAYRQVVQRPAGKKASIKRHFYVDQFHPLPFPFVKSYTCSTYRNSDIHTKATCLRCVAHRLLASFRCAVATQVDVGARCQGPALHRLGEGSVACISNLVVLKPKTLHMAHQTNLQNQKSAHAKSQGMGTRQWGASSPVTFLAPRWTLRLRAP